MNHQVRLNNKYFRPGTDHESMTLNIFFPQGGLGDYINFMSAIQWIANENPHVKGRLFLRQPFMDVAQFILKDSKTFKVYGEHHAKDIIRRDEGVLDPVKFSPYINATGAHLIDLGFMFFCGQSTAFEGYNRLPRINYENGQTSALIKRIVFDRTPSPQPYAVFTPGATVPARAIPPQHFNELVTYVIERGLTPVFLGKRDFTGRGAKTNYFASFNSEYDFSQGHDLREETTLLEAVQIMNSAAFVIGVDNGLLHFAGTTETPIIFGHTVARPDHRNIRRDKGLTIDIALNKESLPCIGCQSNMRFIMGHKFSNCIYGDVMCLDMLFADNCKTWKDAIDFILEKQASGSL